MQVNLTKNQSLAFVMSPRLGDSLISMVTVNNLKRNGFYVTVFSDYLYALRNWFPWVPIFPKPTAEEANDLFKKFDVLLHAYNIDVIGTVREWHKGVYAFEDSPINRWRISMVDTQVEFCKRILLLNDLVRTNNIIIPDDITYRKYPNRVIIHPMSSQAFKSWLPNKFLKLAKKLQRKGYSPEFVMSPSERKEWLWLSEEKILMPEFASLSDVARWIYESGWFIGNDSGIGHLASNLGITTLSLGIRPRASQRWSPTWSEGVVLLPSPLLITRPLKERFWKHFISVNRVMKTFEKMVSK